MKTAIIIGATGLVGMHLTRILLEDPRYDRVKIFVRRPIDLAHEKLETHVVDFNNMDAWQKHITGDVLFSAMGTTLSAAGSKSAFLHADVTIPFTVAQIADIQNVPRFVYISSPGAKTGSRNFYLKAKGLFEKKMAPLGFSNQVIFRPSILVGERDEYRAGESAAARLISLFSKFTPFIRKYRPVHGYTVAMAMANAGIKNFPNSPEEVALEGIFNLAKGI